MPKHGNNINIFSLPLHFGKSISGSFGGECKPDKDIPRYMELCKQGVWNMKGLISQRFKLDEINVAIDSMRKGKTAGRVIIEL